MIKAAVVPVDVEREICLSCKLPECDEESVFCHLAVVVRDQLKANRREYRQRRRTQQKVLTPA